MKKYIIGVVGFFGNGVSTAGGQEAKTCSLTRAFEESYGKDQVLTVDTNNWKQHPFRLLFKLISLAKKCKNVLILPAQNSVRIFVPLFVCLRLIYKCRLHYAVVGGWLHKKTEKEKGLRSFAKKFDGIYVETTSMRVALEQQGFSNVIVVPNFKYINPLTPECLSYTVTPPYRLCTFSRILKEKGIEDAIAAVSSINQKFDETALELDIYGKIDPDYAQRFQELMANAPDYIKYCGLVEPEQSVEILKDYFALLFPTHYATEGVPGTIIDAYAAGVPVITARWENSADVFEDGITGWGYEFGNQEAFVLLLNQLIQDPGSFIKMKKTTLESVERYRPDRIIAIIDKLIEK